VTARVLLTGSRTWKWDTLIAPDDTRIRDVLARARQEWPDAVLVHGDAPGADRIAAALWRHWRLPLEAHPADWASHGRQAGFLRNQYMVDRGADVCLAFIRDHSHGASHTAQLAQAAGIPTRRYRNATPPQHPGRTSA